MSRLPTIVVRSEIMNSWLTLADCSRSELAGKLGISRGRISQLLTSQEEPSAHLIAKLLSLTELPFERLFKIIRKASPMPSLSRPEATSDGVGAAMASKVKVVA